jgi:hypothetical protein
VPPKSWTAWPLPPDKVPREVEQVGEEDPDEAFTFKRREREQPSGVLEDILLGISLKSAKERFEGREWASEEENDIETDVDDKDGLVGPPEEENGDEEPVIKEQTPEKVYLHPVVSADDERSREILRPTIRHTLSKLDDVLMALHHARKTCRRYSSQSAPDTNDEKDSASEEEEEGSTAKRPKGRPSKFENLAHRSRPDEAELEPNTMSAKILRAKKPGRGRKPKQYPRLDGESDQQYLVRIARLQKKPIPIFTSDATAAPKSPARALTPRTSIAPKSPAKSSSPRKNRAPPEDADKKYRRRLGLRDWSEVLGAAALVGFPPDIIARATQRCANLFGESMTMRTMVETPFGDESADTLTTYQPEEIPDCESESEHSESSAGDSDEDEQKRRDGFRQSKPLGYAPKIEVCFCPIKDCPRQVRGFSSTEKMRAHLKRGHRMRKEEIAEFDVASDEEMYGAVHVDGFLRLEKRAMRGHDKQARKRRRKAAGGDGLDGLDVREGTTSSESVSEEQDEKESVKVEEGGSSGDEDS